jgi:anthranilate phosphoribosyltransferase
VAGLADTLESGVQRALELLSTDAARRKVDAFVACTRDV